MKGDVDLAKAMQAIRRVKDDPAYPKTPEYDPHRVIECVVCGSQERLQKCSKCRSTVCVGHCVPRVADYASFCSAEHAKQAWPYHKRFCKPCVSGPHSVLTAQRARVAAAAQVDQAARRVLPRRPARAGHLAVALGQEGLGRRGCRGVGRDAQQVPHGVPQRRSKGAPRLSLEVEHCSSSSTGTQPSDGRAAATREARIMVRLDPVAALTARLRSSRARREPSRGCARTDPAQIQPCTCDFWCGASAMPL